METKIPTNAVPEPPKRKIIRLVRPAPVAEPVVEPSKKEIVRLERPDESLTTWAEQRKEERLAEQPEIRRDKDGRLIRSWKALYQMPEEIQKEWKEQTARENKEFNEKQDVIEFRKKSEAEQKERTEKAMRELEANREQNEKKDREEKEKKEREKKEKEEASQKRFDKSMEKLVTKKEKKTSKEPTKEELVEPFNQVLKHVKFGRQQGTFNDKHIISRTAKHGSYEYDLNEFDKDIANNMTKAIGHKLYVRDDKAVYNIAINHTKTGNKIVINVLYKGNNLDEPFFWKDIYDHIKKLPITSKNVDASEFDV